MMLAPRSGAQFGGRPKRFRRIRAAHASSTFYWISAVFMLLVLAAGILVVLWPKPDLSSEVVQDPTPQYVQEPAIVQPASIPKLAAVCPEQPITEGDLREVLQPVWSLVGNTPVPSSPAAGPFMDGWPKQCFAHSPEGALYSAVTMTAERQESTDATSRIAVVENRFAHVNGYLEQLDLAQKFTARPAGATYQFAGYRWNSYTPERAELEVVVRSLNGSDSGSMYAASFAMIWNRNDWLLLPPPTTGLTISEVTNMSNYIPWGAAG